MNTISVNYAIKWEIDFAPHYKFTKCGKLINTKTGKNIKKILNNRCIGYTIESKFYSLKKLKCHIKLLSSSGCPF